MFFHCHILAHEEMDMMHPMIFAMPPVAPSNLTRTGQSGPLRVNLTWRDNSRNETGWKVQRGPAGTGPWTTIASLPSSTGPEVGLTIAYSDTAVTSGTTYYYRVLATNLVGDTALANFPTISVDSAPTAAVSITV